MRREKIAVAFRASQNSVELVRRVVEGISETAAAPVDLQLLHVAIVFGDGGEREIKAAAKFITQKLQTHLRQLPSTCTWSAHILALRRPTMHLHHDQDMMVAYALCRKAARLGCSELVLKGKGQDRAVLPLMLGHSITHYVLKWSMIPVRLFSKSRGFCCQPPQGGTPRGQDAALWKQNLAAASDVPVLDALLVQHPDGAVGAMWAAA